MNAGRELDALVANKVTGFTPTSTTNCRYDYPPYSTDIAAAWEVVEKMGGEVGSPGDGPYQRKDKWAAFIPCPGKDNGGKWGYGDTAPHAICLAALKAVGVEV